MTASGLIPEQRRMRILRLLQNERVLSYRQLTEALDVSQMTVRRDVAILAGQGRVQVTQGGVGAVAKLLVEPSRAQKAVVNQAEKLAIAREAARMVSDDMTIYLDAGTTVQAIRPFLQDRTGLTIVTNDLVTTSTFFDHPSADIICVGGRVDRANESLIGRLAAHTLSELSLDIAFLSCSSWSLDRGITTPVEAKIHPKRQAIASATTSVLLADSSKYGTHSKYRVFRLSEMGTVFTDGALGDDTARRIEFSGVILERAAPGD